MIGIALLGARRVVSYHRSLLRHIQRRRYGNRPGVVVKTFPGLECDVKRYLVKEFALCADSISTIDHRPGLLQITSMIPNEDRSLVDPFERVHFKTERENKLRSKCGRSRHLMRCPWDSSLSLQEILKALFKPRNMVTSVWLQLLPTLSWRGFDAYNEKFSTDTETDTEAFFRCIQAVLHRVQWKGLLMRSPLGHVIENPLINVEVWPYATAYRISRYNRKARNYFFTSQEEFPSQPETCGLPVTERFVETIETLTHEVIQEQLGATNAVAGREDKNRMGVSIVVDFHDALLDILIGIPTMETLGRHKDDDVVSNSKVKIFAQAVLQKNKDVDDNAEGEKNATLFWSLRGALQQRNEEAPEVTVKKKAQETEAGDSLVYIREAAAATHCPDVVLKWAFQAAGLDRMLETEHCVYQESASLFTRSYQTKEKHRSDFKHQFVLWDPLCGSGKLLAECLTYLFQGLTPQENFSNQATQKLSALPPLQSIFNCIGTDPRKDLLHKIPQMLRDHKLLYSQSNVARKPEPEEKVKTYHLRNTTLQPPSFENDLVSESESSEQFSWSFIVSDNIRLRFASGKTVDAFSNANLLRDTPPMILTYFPGHPYFLHHSRKFRLEFKDLLQGFDRLIGSRTDWKDVVVLTATQRFQSKSQLQWDTVGQVSRGEETNGLTYQLLRWNGYYKATWRRTAYDRLHWAFDAEAMDAGDCLQ